MVSIASFAVARSLAVRLFVPSRRVPAWFNRRAGEGRLHRRAVIAAANLQPFDNSEKFHAEADHYPGLRALLGGWFHQDFDLNCGTL
jgi:hypothetical protein